MSQFFVSLFFTYLIKLFSGTGLRAVQLTLGPTRRKLSNNRREDSLFATKFALSESEEIRRPSPVLTRHALLRTPVIRLLAQAPVLPPEKYSYYTTQRRRRRRFLPFNTESGCYRYKEQEEGVKKKKPEPDPVRELFQPRLIAECLVWLHEPIPAERLNFRKFISNKIYFLSVRAF